MTSKLTVNYIITENNIILNYNGSTHNIPKSSSLAEEVLEAIRLENYDIIPDLVDKSKAVKEFSDDEFNVVNGVVMIGDFEVPQILSEKILQFMKEGLPHKPLVRFANNLMNNPSNKSLRSLYKFLDVNNHPITPDGHFIAYKRVRNDYKDIYTGKIDNSPGSKPTVRRNQVDEDVNVTCSYGLHVANWDYAHNCYTRASNDILLEVKVNPADVVAVPNDYNNSKMRVCSYEVLGAVTNPHEDGQLLRSDENYNNSCHTDYENECEDECEDDYEDDYEYDEYEVDYKDEYEVEYDDERDN